MRTIKFRGLTSNNTWVYGLPCADVFNSTVYYKNGFTHRMTWTEKSAYCNQPFRIDTLGQFTGLLDKNGKEIYEGDVVRQYYYDGSNENQLGSEKGKATVVFNDGCFKLITDENTEYTPIGYDVLGRCRFSEIIGNIHEGVIKNE
jgi:uncharacterized phage protein (TIGR01671 family)